jgi:hypothetical protein
MGDWRAEVEGVEWTELALRPFGRMTDIFLSFVSAGGTKT